MSNPKIYTTKVHNLKAINFNPRSYDPVFLFVKNKLRDFPELQTMLVDEVKGGSTPPYYFFMTAQDKSIPFLKTSAISKDFINLNDLHFIYPDFHYNAIKRSITRPYDVIYSMTGKFMGKAALCPPCIKELNMSQNSVVLRTKSVEHSAFLCIFLNSIINKIQVGGSYSITKQKYINQGKIAKLRVVEYVPKYKKAVELYLDGINQYYDSIKKIKSLVSDFDKELAISQKDWGEKYIYSIPFKVLSKEIFTPQFYRQDSKSALNKFQKEEKVSSLADLSWQKGEEIGSNNYLFEGIPFIKTSDFLNYGVDYQPNYYCDESIYNELAQNLTAGDVIFTKDGKVGEVAILEETAKVVICGGILCIRLEKTLENYWLFLLLSSNYGKIFFNKWTIIASTMAHLRKDFLSDFKFPNFSPEKKEKYSTLLQGNVK